MARTRRTLRPNMNRDGAGGTGEPRDPHYGEDTDEQNDPSSDSDSDEDHGEDPPPSDDEGHGQAANAGAVPEPEPPIPRVNNRAQQARDTMAVELIEMFVRLSLPRALAEAIVMEQGYADYRALARLTKRDVEKLVDVIRKPGGMRGAQRDPGINVPMRHQELIIGACFSLKHQYRTGMDYFPRVITQSAIDDLRIQMQIEAEHDNSVARASRPKWDSKNRAASAESIEDYFRMLRGIEGVPCNYLMRSSVTRPEGPKDKHLSEDEVMVLYYPMIRTGIDLRHHTPGEYSPALFSNEFRYDNTMCYHELKKIVEGTEAEVYVDEFTLTTDFRSAWQRVYNTFLGEGSKDILAGELEAKIANACYTGPRKGFTFTSYVERHKTAYQGMLALEKKTDYRAYDPGTRVRKFLAGIQDPALSQAKLSIQANSDKYGSDFDACVDYLTNCVGMQQSNQRVAVAAAGSSAADNAKPLKTHDAQGCELVMPAIFYGKEQWAQLSKAQQESVRERRNARKPNSSNTRPGRGGGAGGRNRKRQRGNRQSTIDALTTNVTKLTDAVGIMAAQIKGGSPAGSDGDDNVEGDSKMSANSNNPALTKNRKKG